MEKDSDQECQAPDMQFQGKGEVFGVFISWLLCVFVWGGGEQLYYFFLAAS